MKNLVMAAVLALLLFGTNAPTEAATPEAAIGSQVELVEVMHRSHPPRRHHDDWRHRAQRRDDWRDHDRHDQRHRDHRHDRHRDHGGHGWRW